LLFQNFVFQFLSMIVGWSCYMVTDNATYVDLFWPLGLVFIGVFYFFHSLPPNFSSFKQASLQSLIICAFYVICGLRFMIGWFSRKYWKKEDGRWGLWRLNWSDGNSMLGIKNIPINFFAFYQAQAMGNVLFAVLPVHVIATSHDRYLPLSYIQLFAIALWLFSFVMENVADFQLSNFIRKEVKDGRTKSVMQSGLWRYSRHPNYFF